MRLIRCLVWRGVLILDDGFDRELKVLMDPVLKKRDLVVDTLTEPERALPVHCQFVFVTATLPSSLSGYFKRKFPDLHRITTSGLHSTPQRLKQSFVRLKGNTTKESMLVDIIRRSFINDKKKILVFCNTRASVEKIGALIARQSGFNSATLLAGDEKHTRARILGSFVGAGKDGEEDVDILISTDLASRGLDTVLVDHVVNYDFPSTAIDYIHRVGRTARNGEKGEATSIMGAKGRSMALFDSIEMSAKKRMALS
jgi:superfamily II DNA/RNA helicase